MWLFICVFLIAYMYHGLGITLGYHRLLSHRAYKAPKWLEYLIVLGGYLAMEGSPIFWVSTHRLHHRFSDKPGDPHSPVDGLWHAFAGWMIKPRVFVSSEESRRLAPDLYRDPIYRALHCAHSGLEGWLCLTISAIFRLGIFLLFGPVVFFAHLLGSLLAFSAPLIVNLFCHMPWLGYESHACGDQSRNVPVVALLSFGEGWHNNHHAFPGSVRFGLNPREFDMTFQVARLLQAVGLIRDLAIPQIVPVSQVEESKPLVKNHPKG